MLTSCCNRRVADVTIDLDGIDLDMLEYGMIMLDHNSQSLSTNEFVVDTL